MRKTSPAIHFLQKEDVITSIDDVFIRDDGTIPSKYGNGLSFEYKITSKRLGDHVKFQVTRKGESIVVSYKPGECSQRFLVPRLERGIQPEYFVLAGMLFMVVTKPYLDHRFESLEDAPFRLLQNFNGDDKELPDQQVVVLTQILSSAVTIPDDCTNDMVVSKVNGTRPKNLEHLVEIVDKCDKGLMRFDLDGDEKIVVVDVNEARAANIDFLEMHDMHSDRSVGLSSECDCERRSDRRYTYTCTAARHDLSPSVASSSSSVEAHVLSSSSSSSTADKSQELSSQEATNLPLRCRTVPERNE